MSALLLDAQYHWLCLKMFYLRLPALPELQSEQIQASLFSLKYLFFVLLKVSILLNRSYCVDQLPPDGAFQNFSPIKNPWMHFSPAPKV